MAIPSGMDSNVPDRAERGADDSAVVDAADFQRELFSDLDTPVPQREREPEVRFEGEGRIGDENETRLARVSQGGRREEVEDDPRDVALRSMQQQLEAQRRLYESELNQYRGGGRPQPQNIEMMNTPWGQIPKDRNMRMIQVKEEQLDAIGIDSSIAPGLEVLGNVLYNFIASTIPEHTLRASDEISRRRGDIENRTRTFVDTYPDLREHWDYVTAVERNARQQDGIDRIPDTAEYMREVARRSRAGIARMRGQTLEEYEDEIEQQYSRGNRSVGSRQPVVPVGGFQPTNGRNFDRVIERPTLRSRARGFGGAGGRGRGSSGVDPVLADLQNNA